MANDFDPKNLQEGCSRRYYERRVQQGRAALESTPLLPGDDEDTNATDTISDILTALFGPCGTYSRFGGTYHHRAEADKAAQDLLRRALQSWQGDAEDYTEDD